MPYNEPVADNFQGLRHEEVVTADTTSDPVILVNRRPNNENFGVQLSPTAGGTGELEYTMSHPDKVVAGTADWVSELPVSENTGYSLWPQVTAVRCVAVDEDCQFDVVL